MTGSCAERIVTNTIDARLIALDATTGRRCAGFGTNGEVSLLNGMTDARGRSLPGYYYVTSAPTIVRGRVVLGGWVSDAQYWGEPSGVIRAYDAVTGRFAWAFDMGRPDRSTEPGAGERYTPSTPNSWAPMSADEELGLVYAPTGNTTGSITTARYGGRSMKNIRARSSRSTSRRARALVVPDGAPRPLGLRRRTAAGRRRSAWGNGRTARAIQATKTGEIFVLDRTNGTPLSRSPRCPCRPPGRCVRNTCRRRSPRRSACRRSAVPISTNARCGADAARSALVPDRVPQGAYDGVYTPPGVTPFIQYPGILGIEWGSVAVDAERALMIVNASRVANYARLIPRAEADAQGRQPEGLGGHYGQRAQQGTPYAVSNPPFLSPLGVPCQNPPFGTVSAVDLDSGQLVWSRRLGTARDSGPLGLPSLLPFPLGTPNIGGSVTTRSGLVFIGAAQDRYRARDTESGHELWKARLPQPRSRHR